MAINGCLGLIPMNKQTLPNSTYKTDWLKQIDGRTSIAQELKQRHLALCNDLGGYDILSYQQKALIDRAIFLEFHLQQEELKLANGAEFDSGKWVQAANALNGLFNRLGLARQAKEVDLTEYVKAKS